VIRVQKGLELERDIVKLRNLIVRKHTQGWSLDEVASHTQMPRSTCHRWISWAEEGRTLEGLLRYRLETSMPPSEPCLKACSTAKERASYVCDEPSGG